MGMSASQARYLALTSRMNDVEYQGQQINQQRTTLSTQINELYNSLLDISVPTPPSQSDFNKTVYSGTLGATKFTMGTVRPQGNDNYSIDLKYTMAGDSLAKSTKSKSLTPNTETLKYTDAVAEATRTVFNTEEVTTHKQGVAVAEAKSDESEKDIMIKTTASKAKALSGKDGIHFTNASGKEIDSLEGLADNTDVYVLCKVKDILDENAACYSLLAIESAKITNVFYDDNVTKSTVITTPKVGYTDDNKYAGENVEKLGFYTYDGEPGKNTKAVLITSVSELQRAIENNKVVKRSGNGDIQFKNESYKGGDCDYLVTIGNEVTELYSLGSEKGQEELAKTGVDLDNIIKGIRHTFNIPENEMNDEALLKLYSVYITQSESGESTPHFIRNADIEVGTRLNGNYTNIPSYDYDASGTYTDAQATDDCKLEFDASGRITRIGIPNNGDYDWVELTVSTETDTIAYDEAMKEYNYAKIVYDKTQEEINLKTSIVQQQDKNLELKLTRLDNERNALNTELEAVKKVITDNISKTYKTFSG